MRSYLYFLVLFLSVTSMARGSGQSRKPVAPVPGQKAPVAAQKPAAPSAEPDYSKEAFIHEDVSNE
jgi:hypothetical protein